MKARIENNIIKRYIQLPKYYKHWAGNFDIQSDEIHKSEGFYNIITPVIEDYELQKLGSIYFNEELEIFTYPVIEIEIDLEAEREQRKAELKHNVDSLISEALSVGVLEKLVLGEEIPQSFKDMVQYLRGWEEATYIEVDSFTDAKEMKDYKIKQEDIENSKEMLKAGRNM